MAQDQLWDGQCGRESFCREYPDGGGDLSPARAECAGLSYPLLPGLVCRDAASLSATANNKLASNPTTVRSMNGYLRDSLGATVVIVTHELASIFAIGTNAVFLDADSKT